MTESLVIALIVAAIGPLLSYLAAARKLSGRIRDTDATELWAESRSIREWSTARVKDLQDHIEELEERMSELEGTNLKLANEHRIALKEIGRLRSLNEELDAELSQLKRLLARNQRGET